MSIERDLDLLIDAAQAGTDEATASDRTTLDFLLKVKGSTSLSAKIVVETSCPGQQFGMGVVAQNASSGMPAPPVTLEDGMLPQDFLTDLLAAAVFQQVDLVYTGRAGLLDGAGVDLHTVTYTITEQ